jgi:type II secretory pathway component GspD/PulD (secretin)
MRMLLAGLLLLGSAVAYAQMEVIQLRNRTAEEVIPILRPLVEPGGAITGMQYQLIVRASPANVADIRRVLETLDTRPRRLLISVRQDSDAAQSARGESLSGSIYSGSSGTGGTISGRAFDNARENQSSVSQTLQVMEGGIAAINVGQSVPVRGQVVTRTVNGIVVQDTTSYRDVGTGFQVRPRLSGPSGQERVTLEIDPHRDTPGPGGTVNIQRASSVVTGRLGEWMELGGMNVSESRSGSGILSGSGGQGRDNRSIWVKVEELK